MEVQWIKKMFFFSFLYFRPGAPPVPVLNSTHTEKNFLQGHGHTKGSLKGKVLLSGLTMRNQEVLHSYLLDSCLTVCYLKLYSRIYILQNTMVGGGGMAGWGKKMKMKS